MPRSVDEVQEIVARVNAGVSRPEEVRRFVTSAHALGATVVGTVAIALAYISAFVPGGTRWGAWLMVVGLATMVVSLMALGATRRGAGLGPLRIPLAFTFVVIVGCFGAALVLPATEGPGSALFFGLPLRAALVLYGVGLLPLFVLPLVYALTFDAMTLSEADLERVRRMRTDRAEAAAVRSAVGSVVALAEHDTTSSAGKAG